MSDEPKRTGFSTWWAQYSYAHCGGMTNGQQAEARRIAEEAWIQAVTETAAGHRSPLVQAAPDLLAACKRWVALRARCDAPGVGWTRIDRETEDGIHAEIEAAIARAEGTK